MRHERITHSLSLFGAYDEAPAHGDSDQLESAHRSGPGDEIATVMMVLTVLGSSRNLNTATVSGDVIDPDMANNVTQTPIGFLGCDLRLSVHANAVCKGTKCCLKGLLHVDNVGSLPSRKTEIRYYLSDDTVWSGDDFLIRAKNLGALKPE